MASGLWWRLPLAIFACGTACSFPELTSSEREPTNCSLASHAEQTGVQELATRSCGFVVAGPFLYFTEEDSHSIQRVSLADGARSTLFSFAGDPATIDTDGSLIYVTVNYLDPVTKYYTAALLRMTVDGRDPCLVGSAAPFAASLVISGDRAYWTGDCLIHGGAR